MTRVVSGLRNLPMSVKVSRAATDTKLSASHINLKNLRYILFKNEQARRTHVEILPGACNGGAMIEAAIAIPILIALLFAGFAIMQMTLNTTLIERNLELAARAAALESNVATGTILEKQAAVDHAASIVVARLSALNLHTTDVMVTQLRTSPLGISPIYCAISVQAQFVSICTTCDTLGIFSGSGSKTFHAVAAPSECLS